MRGPTMGPVTAGRVSSQASPTVPGSSPSLGAEVLVGLELRAPRLDRLGGAARVAAAPVALLAHDAAEQPALERRPRDHAEPVGLGRRQHLALDRRARSGCRSTAR